jgi:hypothetical protein
VFFGCYQKDATPSQFAGNGNLTKGPPPVARLHAPHPPLSDLGSKQCFERVPPEPDGLLADVDAAFNPKIRDLAELEWTADYSITARRMISGLVLKYRKGERWVIPRS